MARKSVLAAGAAALFLGSIAATVFFFSQRNEELLQPGDAEIVTQGKAVYAANCASCHGNKLEGQPNWKSPGPDGKMPAPPHDNTGHTWHHTDLVLFDLTKYGLKDFAGEEYQSNMPAYENVLSDQETVAVLSFIKSKWPKEIRERHDKVNALSRKGG